MIKRIEITNLFGVKGNDKNIDFNDDLTILVGLNGSGKTTILNIINIIISKQFERLFNYHFDEIKVKFTGERNIRIINLGSYMFILRTDIAKDKDPELNELIERLSKSNEDEEKAKLIHYILSTKANRHYDSYKELGDKSSYNYTEYYDELGSTSYRSRNNDRKDYFIYISKRLIGRKNLNSENFNLKIESIYFPTYRRLETDFMELLDNNSVVLNGGFNFQSNYMSRVVEEMRTNELKGNKVRTIIGYSNKDIEQVVRHKLDRVNRLETILLNKLYSKFMNSLLEPLSEEYDMVELSYSKKGYETQLLEVFKKTGLISNNEEEVIEKISLYVEDIAWADKLINQIKDGEYKNRKDSITKLSKAFKIKDSQKQINKLVSMYQDTIRRVKNIKEPFEVLTKSLSDFLNKEILFHGNNIYFKSGNDRLSFMDLSAGEKQLVSMFVYIWLDIDQGAIVMIDEPELSLHVTWQRAFLSSLMMNTRKTQYIIATHSPFIIGKYKDNVVRIGETEGIY